MINHSHMMLPQVGSRDHEFKQTPLIAVGALKWLVRVIPSVVLMRFFCYMWEYIPLSS